MIDVGVGRRILKRMVRCGGCKFVCGREEGVIGEKREERQRERERESDGKRLVGLHYQKHAPSMCALPSKCTNPHFESLQPSRCGPFHLPP